MIDELDVALRVIGASLLGAAVGYDRLAANKPAGMRTHMLVAAGSALFAGLSLLLADSVESIGAQAARIDVSRVIAGVVTGVGFLGAGAIIRRQQGVVSGLTTAAGIWVVAAIGAVVAFGFWLLGLVATVLVLAVEGVAALEARLRRRDADDAPGGTPRA